ncbi:hypothetical protein ACGFNU_46350 [Spirillospora sp. NPDC048911]|uniref:hypothetical protein n=1 Tax=Spirillospora sp. NPDC048911 TaxID=3364527 RepID=UPI0037215F86
MGMPGYEVDPELISRSGGGIRSSAEQLKTDWAAFQQELSGFGQPWGTDDIGSLIGGCYQAIYEVAVECYEENVQRLTEDADVVTAVAVNYTKAEQSNVMEVNRVRDVLG